MICKLVGVSSPVNLWGLYQGCVGDDELMLRTELQKRAAVVIAVAKSVSTEDSFPQFEVSAYSCVEVS